MTTTLLDRVATAPISWGICDMPAWGHQLPVESVLTEMAAAGFTHTELGQLGYLPTKPGELRATLGRHGLSLLGGFVPLVLHETERITVTLDEAVDAATIIAGGGGRFFVTCVVSSRTAWRRGPLAGNEWNVVAETLARVDKIAADFGLTQAIHPHLGSLVESDAETRHILDLSDVSLVFDSAHLLLGGADVLDLARCYLDRIALVHIKDLDLDLAAEVVSGRLTLMQGAQRGLFPPLGRGGAPIAEIVSLLEGSERYLWYVLEQDAAIEEGDPTAVERLRRDARLNLEFLRNLASARAGARTPHNRNPERRTIR